MYPTQFTKALTNGHDHQFNTIITIHNESNIIEHEFMKLGQPCNNPSMIHSKLNSPNQTTQ